MKRTCLLTLAALWWAVPTLRADDALVVLLPAEIKLSGTQAYQTLLVEESRGGHYVGQVREGVTFESSNPQVVIIDEGVARPIGNGEATITAKVGERIATAKVTVSAVEKPFRWSFRNHVESVLAKAGCSSGACHGAQAGKNGFKLSLRGYDPDGDFNTITRQARGRRIVRAVQARRERGQRSRDSRGSCR